MVAALSLLAFRPSALLLAADVGGFLDPDGFINASGSVATDYAAAATDVATVVEVPQTFVAVVSQQQTLSRPRINLRVPWTVKTASAGTPSGRIRVRLLLNGVSVTSGLGAIRSLHPTNGTRYTDLIVIEPSAAFIPKAGDALTVSVDLEVTTASGSAGSTIVLTLRHDPALSADQFVMELQGGGL